MGPDLLLSCGHPSKGKSDQNRNGRRENVEVDLPVLPEHILPSLLDLRDTFHALDRGVDQVAVVAYRDISALLEIDGRVLS